MELLLSCPYMPSRFACSPLIRRHTAHLRQECHNTKFDIFELLVQKETFADALLTVVVL